MNTDISLTGGFEGFPRLLKPDEVASLLGISKSFAYRLLQIGTIPTVRLGKACRVRPQDLEAYIEQNIHSQTDDLIQTPHSSVKQCQISCIPVHIVQMPH